MGSQRLTEEEIAKIRNLRAETDLTLPEIAKKVGRSLSALQRALKGSKSNGKMVRAGYAPKTGGWQPQLVKLVERIRRMDPGVTAIELDVTNGRYTVNRVSSERGEIS